MRSMAATKLGVQRNDAKPDLNGHSPATDAIPPAAKSKHQFERKTRKTRCVRCRRNAALNEDVTNAYARRAVVTRGRRGGFKRASAPVNATTASTTEDMADFSLLIDEQAHMVESEIPA
jgi:hypothetical protein